MLNARNHQPCNSAVSSIQLNLDLNPAEGRNFRRSSKTKEQVLQGKIKYLAVDFQGEIK